MTYINNSNGQPACAVHVDEWGRPFTHRKIDRDVHVFRHHNAICYEDKVLEEARELGVEYHVIEWKGENLTQYVTEATVKAKGISVTWYEKQTGIKLNDWGDGEMPDGPQDPVEMNSIPEAA